MPNKISAGDLRYRISFERATETRDQFNNLVLGPWELLMKRWADKQDLRDSERIAAREHGADISTRFRVRWSPEVAEVTPKDRIICDGRTYLIVGIKSIGFKDGIEFTTSARIDQ